ncbi:MAG TPA: hypothetical protein VKX17_11925 [Planctomycetota bacterium]|nr:hypothetical protein [Planctomycetota bacterium]
MKNVIHSRFILAFHVCALVTFFCGVAAYSGDASVAGSWTFNAIPAINGSSTVTFLLDSGGKVTNPANGLESGTYTLSGDSITIIDKESSPPQTLTFSGTVSGNGMSGSYTYVYGTSFPQTGTFTATRQGGKFAAAEFLTRKLFKQKSGNALFDDGQFKIVASVSITDAVVSGLKGTSAFKLSFGALQQTINLDQDPSYTPGATKVVVVIQDPTDTIIQTTYKLDWSGKGSLKISISGDYSRQILPTLGQPKGQQLQALNFIAAPSGKQLIGATPCTVEFGTSQTTLFVVSGVSVKTTSEVTGGVTYTQSKVGIVSTTLK